jgi:hypothetical protein
MLSRLVEHCNNYMQNIPSHAFVCHYAANNGKRGNFYVWDRNGKWYWQALGNNGECDTEQQATTEAKTWIRDSKVPTINKE